MDHTVLAAIHEFIHEYNEPHLSSAFPAEAGAQLPTTTDVALLFH